MTGRIFHAVSMLLAAGSLLTGCTGRNSSEPETPSAQTQTAAVQTAAVTTAAAQKAAAAVTTAAKQQAPEPDDSPEMRVPVPEADIIAEPVQPEQPAEPEQPGEPEQPEQPMITGPWIEFDD